MEQSLEEELNALLESYGIKSCRVLFSEYGVDVENIVYVDGIEEELDDEDDF